MDSLDYSYYGVYLLELYAINVINRIQDTQKVEYKMR